MAHATIDDIKHGFSYTVTGNAAAKLESLKGEGPLLIKGGHMLSEILDELLVKKASGEREVTLRLIEFISTAGELQLAKEMLSQNSGYTIRPERLAQFLADVDDKGISKTPTSIEGLVRRVREVCEELPHTVEIGRITPNLPTNDAERLRRLRRHCHGHRRGASCGFTTRAAWAGGRNRRHGSRTR